MSMNENLRDLLDELIQEIQNELEEATTTGNVKEYLYLMKDTLVKKV